MGILDNSRLLKKVGNREFPGNGNSRKSLQAPMQNHLFRGPQKKTFSEKRSTFSREKSTFPREILKKSTKVFKNGCSFPVGNSRRNKSGVGTGIPDPKKVGIGIHLQGTQPYCGFNFRPQKPKAQSQKPKARSSKPKHHASDMLQSFR